MPTAKGWSSGQTPVAAPGLKVNAFATGLRHPRWIHVLPNGDVLVAEALTETGPARSLFDYAMFSTMQRAGAAGSVRTGSPGCATRTATVWRKPGTCFWRN